MYMRFYPVKCNRRTREQVYIMALCGCWKTAPDSARKRILQTIKNTGASPKEGRALFAVLVRGQGPKAVSARTGIELARLYELRRDFLNSFPIF